MHVNSVARRSGIPGSSGNLARPGTNFYRHANMTAECMTLQYQSRQKVEALSPEALANTNSIFSRRTRGAPYSPHGPCGTTTASTEGAESGQCAGRNAEG